MHGFAKVGYPGCIYCEGTQLDVETFVAKIKAMQWLALRVRFVEELRREYGSLAQRAEKYHEGRSWVELSKVGEVVEYMHHVGRKEFVLQLGLGSSSTSSPS